MEQYPEERAEAEDRVQRAAVEAAEAAALEGASEDEIARAAVLAAEIEMEGW